MGRLIIVRVFAAVVAAVALIGSPLAAEKSIKAQLVGSWSLVSNENTLPNGTRFNPFENGKGMLVFDRTGHFSWILLRGDIPKIASGNRTQLTADELKAVALGTLAYFGTYSVDAKTKTLSTRVQASSFVNFLDQEQKRTISLKGNDLQLSNSSGASGGTAVTIWKRVE